MPYKSKKLKNLKLAVQRLVLICPAIEARNILGNNGQTQVSPCHSPVNVAGNEDEEPIDIVGKKRSNAFRDESETCIGESSIDEPKAANLGDADARENDTAAAPPDVCLTLEAAVCMLSFISVEYNLFD